MAAPPSQTRDDRPSPGGCADDGRRGQRPVPRPIPSICPGSSPAPPGAPLKPAHSWEEKGKACPQHGGPRIPTNHVLWNLAAPGFLSLTTSMYKELL